MLPAALLHAQLSIQQFSTIPSIQSLTQLRNSLQTTLLMLPIPVNPTVVSPLPSERVKTPKLYGVHWQLVKHELTDLYGKMIHTCIAKNMQTFLVRFQTAPYVFSEVFMGKIVFPLFDYFRNVIGSFDDAYASVVEPVFVYFANHEGQTYNAEDAFRAVGNIPNATRADFVFLISVLEAYDPSKFRSTPHRGNIQIMFNPSKTRSVRDLSLDLYIQSFMDVRDMLCRQTKPDDSSDLPAVVGDVFASVFA